MFELSLNYPRTIRELSENYPSFGVMIQMMSDYGAGAGTDTGRANSHAYILAVE